MKNGKVIFLFVWFKWLWDSALMRRENAWPMLPQFEYLCNCNWFVLTASILCNFNCPFLLFVKVVILCVCILIGMYIFHYKYE